VAKRGQPSRILNQICANEAPDMVVFLYSLSDLSVTILFTTVAALAFIVAPLLRVRLFGHVSEATSETARTTMTMITGFTGVVLAFSLVQAQGNLRSVERVVAAEAMQLDQADRLLTSYGDANVAAIREAVRAYAQSIVTDEWPKLSEHDSSQRTGDLFRSLSRQILAIQPTPGRGTVIYSDLVRIADQLAESRQERLEATDLGLPPIFWEAIGILMVLLVTYAAFVEPRRAISLGGVGAGLALLISLVFIFDQPFLGQVSATPAPVVKALQVISARTS
jgi:Protein of unknown function (DUF4239)